MTLKKILKILLLILIFLYPSINSLGYAPRGDQGCFISVVNVGVVIFDIFFLIYILMDARKQRYDAYWSLGALAIITIFALSILFSPFQYAIYSKGLVQICGVLAAAMVGLAIINLLSKDTDFFIYVVLTIKWTIFILAIIGVLQFFYFNFATRDGLFNFSFLNTISNMKVWKVANIDGVARAHAYVREPAHFAAFLNLGSGFVLVRFGALGKEAKRNIAKHFSLSWALIVLAAFAATLSVLAMFMLVWTYLSLMIFMRAASRKKIILLVAVCVLMTVVAGVFVPSSAGMESEFFKKLGSIPIIFYSSMGINSADFFGIINLSALAVGTNIFVMLKTVSTYVFGAGVGGSLEAYLNFIPPYAKEIPGLYLLGGTDASSLFTRLLTEIGIVGAMFYLLWVGGIFLKSMYALKKISFSLGDNVVKIQTYLVLLKGIYASSLSLFMYYLVRSGAYYDFEYWLALSLVASIPYVIKQLCCYDDKLQSKT